MATANTIRVLTTIECVKLRLTKDEASLLRAVLASVSVDDSTFSDDEAGELEYDTISETLVGLYKALVDAEVPTTYSDLRFSVD